MITDQVLNESKAKVVAIVNELTNALLVYDPNTESVTPQILKIFETLSSVYLPNITEDPSEECSEECECHCHE